MTAETDPAHVTDKPFVGRILLDVPAEHPTFRFEQMAEALAAIVMTSEPRFAVGIFGGWGSGKSTLMNEIERRVSEQSHAVVVRFNAWRYEREPHLIVPLLDTVRASLSTWAADPAHTENERERVRVIARRVGRVIRALVRATTFSIGLPGGLSLDLDPGKALDDLNPRPDDTASSPQSLYFGAFQELATAFGEVEGANLSRIVVFVDDLDRCLPTSALTVLESMKLFFDMPGFVFVVGLDERVVESAVRTKFAAQDGSTRSEIIRQVEREYLKKIFQVPYTLPSMAPGQLVDLLRWMEEHGKLGESQRQDLHERVRLYLRYLATEGRINPREVKRYLNAYTLHRMVRPDLDPATVLALQTIDFRSDWDKVYEDIVLAEPDLFVAALNGFRKGDAHAFEDLWPEIGVLPLELSDFLRSDEAAPLAATQDLERYVSFLETTRTTQSWVKDAMREVGTLRQHVRRARPPLQFASTEARTIAVQVKDVLGRLGGYQQANSAYGPRLERPLAKLQSLISVLAPSSADQPEHTTPAQLEDWRQNVRAEIDVLQQELRLIRRSSESGPG